MLSTGEAISAAGKFAVNQGSNTVETDQGFRDRALFFLTQIAKKVDLLAPWWWKLATSGSVSVATSSGDLPADFNSMGAHGQVYISGQQFAPLTYMEPGEFYALRVRESTTTAQYPTVYTLGGKTALGRPQIQVHPPVSSAITLDLRGYVKRTPDLIDRPPKITTLTEGAAGLLSGAYTYKVTYVNALGETEPSAVSSSLTVTLKKIELTGIPVSTNRSVTSRKLYRTAASGTDWKLVATISDNTTTSYSDNTADGSLGASAPAITAAVTGFEIFPESMQESVLLEGLIAKFQESQGDLRAKKRLEDFEGEIRRAWGLFREGQNQAFMLPAYGEGNYTNVERDFARRGI